MGLEEVVGLWRQSKPSWSVGSRFDHLVKGHRVHSSNLGITNILCCPSLSEAGSEELSSSG
jgi:hypothetical protein